jgi:Kef-type K+ transport system membrane component KefB
MFFNPVVLASLCCVQVGLTVVGVAAFALHFAGLTGPSAIILGGALAMSTTAVAIQVLEDRGEMGSRWATGAAELWQQQQQHGL